MPHVLRPTNARSPIAAGARVAMRLQDVLNRDGDAGFYEFDLEINEAKSNETVTRSLEVSAHDWYWIT